ncbi:MAG: peptidase M48 family protein [Proteobacteria bacterium]|nr:peptidase M48 family protein [Pseudomonadota bacterium]
MRVVLTILFFILCFLPAPISAQQGMSIIRDTEIEQALREWSTPIWRAANLNPDTVKIVLVQSPDLNAFVAGGQNIFIYTGLITAAKSPGELLGVIAHETGHISGGHLIRGKRAMERASYEAVLAAILGVGAAAAGSAEASRAIILGGQGLAVSGFLAHSRVQESSADQAALGYMEEAGLNPSGLASFLMTLKQQELLPSSQQSAYLRTHPLTSERIAAMQDGAAKSKFIDSPYPAAMKDRFARIKAKLDGFINTQRVAWIYTEKDTSIPALYAKAIAAYRRSEKDKALALADQLISKEGQNPWFHEIKGQMLRDFGQLDRAAVSYRKAIALAPDAALIRIDLAQVLIEMPGGDTGARYAEAEKNLDAALQKEPRSSQIHRLYATIAGRRGDEPAARYHLAEEAALRGNFAEAGKLLEAAMPGLEAGSRIFRRANDLKVFLDSQPKKDDRNER